MFEVIATTGFSAAHRLKYLDGKFENLHGHNWTAQVTVEADELDPIGVGIDFVKLKEMVEKIHQIAQERKDQREAEDKEKQKPANS